ncbi:diguanylate cyclase/phosphodiesterase with PAS/PAC and periplasmic/7TM domain sensor(s) [Hyphomicrobium denitrificans ATCC 51888]|uniref:Diguanylate cyclase/phosphodiesterase with PAS/PAC and periplasmic/7TM domain sensor(S) n=1 Tax=Hyphomicrobium denitrificans (strain ATCC 51888 / DSM 1869 / NCIMB 11706 / TK 0415) TaxID=582899 RepID=D8JUR3_HYPDA|nr:sensor domain-containing phosphodiesterase [Hyphomicrobium denitrificans]ADJ24693.1 diguanylate cyclase/phosphodiesterase with PAS/PAC and periplasmic/7TM domain sensor(s) [Hyphomicrobium denitrificans ATCC 51888]
MRKGGRGNENSGLSRLAVLAVAILWMLGLAGHAAALTPIPIQDDQDRVEITNLGEAYEGRGDSLQVETSAGQDGVSGRMTVRASVPGTSPNWMVFALTNKTDKSLERLLAADRYSIVGSGTVWPDLDARRIESVTPSVGFVPERIKSDKADVFRITLEPGQTITYVAELAGEHFSRLYLWKPIDYEIKSRDRQLFNGAMLGLTGLLAIFLTAIFAANHKLIFPAAALVSWTVLSYLCVDFGFFHKLFNLRPEDNAVYRAAGEAAMASSFVIFLSTFLRLGLWHGMVRMMIGVWMVAQLTLIAVAVIDPRLAATFARLSFLMIGGVGGLFTLFLAFKGQDRALSLVPTWLLLLVWIFATGMTLSGRMSGDVVVSSLIAGLVLVVILMGFTVTQYAFRSSDAAYAGAPTELQGRSLALAASGSTVWEWNIRRDEIKVSPEVEIALSLMPGELSTKVEDFLRHVHPTDKERFRVMMMSAQERSGVRIRTDFRLRHSDNSWRWFELEAASVPNSDGRTLRCVGLLRDVSDMKRAHERLLHDAVNCSLTGLPNRELFLDRLKGVVSRAKTDGGVRPAVIFIDLDKFKSINSSFGLVRGDSLLLTVARRLQRHLGPHDTVARVGGDQFAMLFVGEREARNLPALAERVRRSLRAPIPLANQEVILTGSIGVAAWDENQSADGDLLKDAELAMYRAKRAGADRIEVFDASMRRDRDSNIGAELAKAIEKGQLKVVYQPIVYLPTKELAGFEAFARWEHPKLGLVNPASVIDEANEPDAMVKVSAYLLLRAAKDASRWLAELPRPERPLFVTVNISSPHIFKPESIQEIRHILGRNIVPPGTLRLEIAENLMMGNPEQAIEVLKVLRGSGAELSLDEFGTGYSSLAYLNRFPFDTIKVCRGLVRGSGTANGAAIMRSMVALAHELSKTVVAEGVERADEATFLRSIGCEYAQGYHFGEPIPERAVAQLLKMVRRSERKMQPRGFFRPKFKNAAKKVVAQAARPAAAIAKSVANGEAKTTTAPPQGAAKAAALPAGSVVRHRHKPDPKAVANGASPNPVANAGAPGTPGMPSKKPADALRVAVAASGPALPPAAAPSLPPELLQTMERRSVPPQNPRAPANGHAAPGAPPFRPAAEPAPAAPPRQAILAPLSEALARAAASDPTTGRPAPQRPPANGMPPASPGEPQPRRAEAPLPPPPPVNVTPSQPDFSTLPPSIAASLARLAGNAPASGEPENGAPRTEQKIASKG